MRVITVAGFWYCKPCCQLRSLFQLRDHFRPALPQALTYGSCHNCLPGCLGSIRVQTARVGPVVLDCLATLFKYPANSSPASPQSSNLDLRITQSWPQACTPISAPQPPHFWTMYRRITICYQIRRRLGSWKWPSFSPDPDLIFTWSWPPDPDLIFTWSWLSFLTQWSWYLYG